VHESSKIVVVGQGAAGVAAALAAAERTHGLALKNPR